MEVYKEIKKDLMLLIALIWASYFIVGAFDISLDTTDKDGFNRSNMELLIDNLTGLHYLSKSGALIPRLDSNGVQIRDDK